MSAPRDAAITGLRIIVLSFGLDLLGPGFIINNMNIVWIKHRLLIPVCLVVCLTMPAIASAQIARKDIGSAIPHMTTPRSTVPAYLIAIIAFIGVVAVAMRSANRGRSRGGRE